MSEDMKNTERINILNKQKAINVFLFGLNYNNPIILYKNFGLSIFTL